jgi:hypothetical protein
MKTTTQIQAEINSTPMTEQAKLRSLYTELSRAYAEQLRPTR